MSKNIFEKYHIVCNSLLIVDSDNKIILEDYLFDTYGLEGLIKNYSNVEKVDVLNIKTLVNNLYENGYKICGLIELDPDNFITFTSNDVINSYKSRFINLD